MLKATLEHASLLKKILDAMKDLVTEANFVCSEEGISVQAIDMSHVSLVTLLLRKSGFAKFKCERNMTLGINLSTLSKVLKFAANDDQVTIKAAENTDTMTLIFESPKNDRISDWEIKLIDIESDTLGIPAQEYQSVITMPSDKFQKICRDMKDIGDTVVISADKQGVKFSVSGEIGGGYILCRQGGNVDDAAGDDSVSVQLEEPISLTFALKFLNYFTKATALSSQVILSMAKEVPLVTEYRIEQLGYVRYYLAPKIEDDS